jgi:hypothetical protein
LLPSGSQTVAIGQAGIEPPSHQDHEEWHPGAVDSRQLSDYPVAMKAVEFETELNGKPDLHIPSEAAAQLPDAGKARVIVLVEEDGEDAQWRKAAYERFMSEDSPEDAVYDKYAR